MSSTTIYELIGYVGSALVVISLAMSSIIRLRVVNLAGALVFTDYGARIGSIPVVITNLISGLDVWYLRKERTTREAVTVVRVAPTSGIIGAFIDHHRDDLASYGYVPEMVDRADVCIAMLRDTVIAGIFLAVERDDDTLQILVDHVAPAYRDRRSGASLYGPDAHRFRELGYRTLLVSGVDPRQRSYVAAMGFTDGEHGAPVLETRHG